uniref:Alternative protein HAO1 n=1 Tax=Homo sapiens TaxID=9606 RepID=L8E8S6_HUMAN|nr:alternative protein HAO1 [Homo sapiens]
MIMNNMLNQYFQSLYMTITGLGQMMKKLWLIILQHFPDGSCIQGCSGMLLKQICRLLF